MSAQVHENDTVVRESAAVNFRNIAAKVDVMRAEVGQRMHEAMMRAIGDDDPDFTDRDAQDAYVKDLENLDKNVRRLLHGMATMMEMGRNGYVYGEDETSMTAVGMMVVGLVDHGDNWSTHS